MKNIRILEDGNRLIVVLEGYEKSAMGTLVEMLGATAMPLSHIKPYTRETSFQFKGTEKEVPLSGAAKELEMPIKQPAFMEQLKAGNQVKAADTATKAAGSQSAQVEQAAQADARQQEEVLEAPIPAQDGGPAQKAEALQKPAEFMDSFELRAYIRQADIGKVSALLKKKGRFPNAMHLMNSNDQTIREYVKELLITE